MESVMFASFGRRAEAHAAIRELRRAFVGRTRVRIRMHAKNEPSSELDLVETHARAGILVGALCGVAAGAAAGFLMTRAVSWVDTSTAINVLFCAFLGLVIGTLSAVLVSPMNPARALQRIALRTLARGAVVSVETFESEDQKQATLILHRHASSIEHKAPMGGASA